MTQARITLARAVYSSAQTLLLDDVSFCLQTWIVNVWAQLRHTGSFSVGCSYVAVDCEQMLQGRSHAGTHSHSGGMSYEDHVFTADFKYL